MTERAAQQKQKRRDSKRKPNRKSVSGSLRQYAAVLLGAYLSTSTRRRRVLWPNTRKWQRSRSLTARQISGRNDDSFGDWNKNTARTTHSRQSARSQNHSRPQHRSRVLAQASPWFTDADASISLIEASLRVKRITPSGGIL